MEGLKSSSQLWAEFFSSLPEDQRKKAINLMLGACIGDMPHASTREHIDTVRSLLKGGA